MDIVTPLNAFSAVGPGERANVRLPVGAGLGYARIVLQTSLTPAEITRVTLTLNTVVMIDMTGAELVMRRQYFGLPEKSAEGLYMLDLRTPVNNYRSRQGRDATSLITGPGDSVSLEVDIAPGVTAPTLKGWAITFVAAEKMRGRTVPMQRRTALTIRRQSFQTVAAGEVENANMVTGARLLRAHIGGGTGAIDSLRIERNQQNIFDAPKGVNDLMLESAGLVPQAGYYHLDPTNERFAVQDALITAAESFLWKMNATTAGTIPFLFERLEAG